MNPTISCNSLVEITTPQTIKIEGHIKKKNVQEVKDHIEHQEMNPTISCKGLEEKRAKGLCYNCDNKYIKGHKCVEKKLLYIDCEEEEEKEQERSK